MPFLSTILPLMAAAAGDPSAQVFVFKEDAAVAGTAVSRQKLYQQGGYGYEPAGEGEGFLFSVAVPEGNYRVTVTLGDARRTGNTTVKAESRRLMLRDIRTQPGRFETRTMMVNVRTPSLPPPPENAPGGNAVRLNAREEGSLNWDEKLTLEFLGDPQVAAVTIAPVDVPTVYLAGDSTVTDQRYETGASWGQMLPALLDTGVVVANHAESGETLKSFLTGLRFDKLLSRMKAGDWLFIQFGHNDQKDIWPQTYVDPQITYPAYLRAYIAEVRRRGAHPVLVTSPERRNFDAQGRIVGSLGDYAAAMRDVAKAEQVPLIDLNATSRTIYEALGPDRSALAFNRGGADRTHHDNYGAWLLANAVAEGIRSQVPELATHIASQPFDVAHPPTVEAVGIVPSLGRRPAGR